MTHPVWSSGESLPPDVRAQINAVCSRFGQAWQQDEPPCVEEYLAAWREKVGRTTLLRELLRLELDYRRRQGENPRLQEYQDRFPGDDDVLQAVFVSWNDLTGPPLEAQGAAASLPALPGSMQVPGYANLGELGRGAMGVVYQAQQVQAGRVVALKTIRAASEVNEEGLARFRLEAEALARMKHLHVVQVYEVGEHQGVPFFSMEFCEGGNLAHRLQQGSLSAQQATQLVESVARGIHAAHERGIIHRDLKPANILMTREGIPKVSDFGLARKTEGMTRHTVSGALLGTPAYMAPEQAAGRGHAVDARTDVYALGVILYECLTGQTPFQGDLEQMLREIRDRPPPPPARITPDVPRDLETICLKCLEKERERRYASAEELAEDLHRFRQRQPIEARRAGVGERLVLWARRRPSRAGLVLLSVLLVGLAGVAAGMAWLWREAETVQRQLEESLDREREARNALNNANARLVQSQEQVAQLLYFRRVGNAGSTHTIERED